MLIVIKLYLTIHNHFETIYSSSLSLFNDKNPLAQAELHWRIAMPIFTLILAILALPLARSEPRQAHYGRLILAFLSYLVGMNLMLISVKYIGSSLIPAWLGLWWLHLPMLVLAMWMFSRDGKFASSSKRSQA